MSPIHRTLATQFSPMNSSRHRTKLLQSIIQHYCGPKPLLSRQHGGTTLQPYIKSIIIFSCVIAFSLLAAWIGCVVASCCCRRKARPLATNRKTEIEAAHPAMTHTPFSSCADGSSDYDLEMMIQLDTIMASNMFDGREWTAYKREQQTKARRYARGFMRTSQGIMLPTNVHQLKHRMGRFSRSLMLSMGKSEPLQEPTTLAPIADQHLARTNGVVTNPQDTDYVTAFDSRNGRIANIRSSSTSGIGKQDMGNN